MYNVGFGDCFLLTFPYASGGDRHLLIDFGSHPRPAGAPSGFMEAIARDIAARCQGGRLAVVATHRHADHIAGFATRGGKASGDIIRALKPDIVIQPWTEHPTAARDAHAPALRAAARGFHRSLAAMERFAAAFVQGLDGLPRHVPRRLRERLAYIGEDVIKNKSAVENLMTMGRRKARYVHAGRASGLATFLPGVKIHVLGPPTLAQAPDIRAYAKESEDYWLRRRQIALAGRASAKGRGEAGLFARAQRRPAGKAPAHATWFIERMRRAYADELLGIVTVLDKVLNNTSIILLIEVAGQKLLFPGDAQLENWSYALTKYRKLLQGVTVYKVGHHGSLNATPRRLWTLLTAGDTAAAPDAFTTLLSTLPDVHGGEDDRPTEVPRRTLVDALKARSRYHSTLDGPGVGQAQVIPPP
jgi:hypothetical protein